jgi:hypothetical protein
VRVRFLYYEDCLSHNLAFEGLRNVMAEEDTLFRLLLFLLSHHLSDLCFHF